MKNNWKSVCIIILIFLPFFIFADNVFRVIGTQYNIRDISISFDDKYIISGGEDNNVILWDFETGEMTKYEGHNWYVTGVEFTSDNNFAVSCSWDDTIRIWNILR